MNQDVRVYSVMVEHDQAVPMIEQIDQMMDALLNHETAMIEVIKRTIVRAKLDHHLIVQIANPTLPVILQSLEVIRSSELLFLLIVYRDFPFPCLQLHPAFQIDALRIGSTGRQDT